MSAHLWERIEFETREGKFTGRLSRWLGGADYIVQVDGSDRKFAVKHLEDGRWVIPALVDTAI